MPRDGYGRPLVRLPDNFERLVPYTRCTTFVGVLEDQTALGRWKQRKTARGLAKRRDLANAVAAQGDMPEDDGDGDRVWKKEMDALCESAIEADGASVASRNGTTLHRFAQRDDQREDVSDLPVDLRPHLEAYRRSTAGFDWRHIEEGVVLDALKIHGTPDRIARLPGRTSLTIVDIKTGTLDWGQAKMAMQLSVYAHSQLYDPATGVRTEMGDVDLHEGLIIALHAKKATCQMYWIDLKTGWDGVKLARDVREWRGRRKFTTPYDGQVLGLDHDLVAEAQANLSQAIDHAASPEALVDLWRRAGTAWTEAHTQRAAVRKAQLQAA
jgi:hypothetical protein